MKFFIYILFLFSFFTYAESNLYEIKKVNIQGKDLTYREFSDNNIIDTEFELSKQQNIEVLYIFSYFCPSCYAFNDYSKIMEQKIKNKKNIRYEKIPFYTKGNKLLELNAKTFFYRKMFKFNSEFDNLIFDMVHEKKLYIDKEDTVRNLFIQYGNIKTEIFDSIETKNKIDYRLNRVNDMLNRLYIVTTPTIIIHKDGKRFLINASDAETPDNMFLLLSHLIDN